MLDRWTELVRKCKYLPENELRKLCDLLCDILLEESNVQPVTIFGNIHGQFYDLQQLFSIEGEMPHTKYIFMGYFVDRCYYSLETLTWLMAMKVRYPSMLVMLRGRSLRSIGSTMNALSSMAIGMDGNIIARSLIC